MEKTIYKAGMKADLVFPQFIFDQVALKIALQDKKNLLGRFVQILDHEGIVLLEKQTSRGGFRRLHLHV